MASQSPHLFTTADDGKEYAPIRRLVIGSSASPVAIGAADEMEFKRYYSTAMTSGTNYVDYIRLDVSGAGVEGIAGRRKTLLTGATVGNAHGGHDTLEVTSTGMVTGLGTGLRGNVVFASDTAVTTGTYYGVMAEIYPAGNTSALPAGSNACLCCSAPAGTALDAVVNAIAFNGTDGATSMIYSATDASPDWTGSIRILVNGAIRYLHYTSAAAS